MTRPDIDAIRARVEVATEGPWEKSEALDSTEYGDYMAYGVHQVAPLMRHSDSDQAHTSLEAMSAEDAEFIANARQDIPALLSHIEQLEAQIERVRGLHKPMTAYPGGIENVVCAECYAPSQFGVAGKYPCPTIRALGGDGE